MTIAVNSYMYVAPACNKTNKRRYYYQLKSFTENEKGPSAGSEDRTYKYPSIAASRTNPATFFTSSFAKMFFL